MLTWRIWTSCPQLPQPRFRARDLHALLVEIQLPIFCCQIEIIMLEVTVVIHHNGIEHTREAKLN